MSRGQGVTLSLPSGHQVQVSPRYRYALVIDAGAGSWVERRADSLAPIRQRLNNCGPSIWQAAHVFDTSTGREVHA